MTTATKGFHTLSEFQAIRWVSNAFLDIDCYTATCEILRDANLGNYQPTMRMPTGVIVGEDDFAAQVNVGANAARDAGRDTVDIAEGSAPGAD